MWWYILEVFTSRETTIDHHISPPKKSVQMLTRNSNGIIWSLLPIKHRTSLCIDRRAGSDAVWGHYGAG